MRKIIPKNAVLIPEKAQRVFQGVIYDAYHWDQPFFDGSSGTFEMLKRADTVVAVGVVDNKLLVIDDTQAHVGSHLGFPGGRVEPTDASTLSAVKREIWEEAGYEFANWRLVEVYQPFVKIEWFVYIYLAWDVTKKGEPQNDPGEKIQVELKAFEQVHKLARQKVGDLGESRDLLEEAGNLNGLLALPEFKGTEVDR